MYTIFILNILFVIYLISAGILLHSLSQINLFDMNTIMLAVRILIQGKYN